MRFCWAMSNAFVAACVLSARVAHADGQASALAQHLFDEAMSLMSAGDLDRACPKFAESQRLDPGGGTLVNLGRCYEAQGKTASAWSVYRDAASVARRERRDERITFAESRLRELEARVPHLTIHVEPTPGVLITLDEAPIGRALYDTSMPIDPGVHVVTAVAPGFTNVTRSVPLAERQRLRVDIPALEKVAAFEDPAPNPRSTRSTHPLPTRTEPLEPATLSPIRTIGWIAIGGGAVAVLSGAVFGALAIENESIADGKCPGSGPCSDDAALAASDRAHAFATVSTVSLVTAGVLAVSGIAMVLLAPRTTLAPKPTARGFELRF